jgi:16S rRNA C967 or C1407 C5-methylase (RsmB/RsmF family)/NOL1/NOP2/fmu family ribosome biogenesis protein
MELPSAFENQMRQILGTEYGAFRASLEEPSPTSIRLNPQKRVEGLRINEPVPWCTDGFYLEHRPVFTLDPLFHAGAFYVQEASSMVIERLFQHIPKSDKPLAVLDLCAAPGGKTTHLLSLISPKDILIANEVHPQRAIVLEENLTRWGNHNVLVTKMAAHQLAAQWYEIFDVILVDAPCSGEGMFRKDMLSIKEWSAENIERCVIRQQDILMHAMNMLAPGGHLIYSTCTYNTKENEAQVQWMLTQSPMEINLPEQAPVGGILKNAEGFRCYPHLVKGEGFFCSMLQKTTSSGRKDLGYLKPYVLKPALLDKKLIRQEDISYVDQKVPLRLLEGKSETIKLYPEQLLESHYDLILSKSISKSGIIAGHFKGKTLFVPDHELAMSSLLSAEVAHLDTTNDQAIDYLRKVSLDVSNPKPGYQVIRFEQQTLGWIKCIPGRINNLLPNHLRIRM